jgi:DNA replication protein DnaC
MREIKEIMPSFAQTDNRTKCKVCNSLYIGNLGDDFICIDCKERLEVQREMQELKSKKLESLLKNANIPARYKNAGLTPKNEAQKKALVFMVDNFRADLSNARDLLLFGSIGAGKTHLAIAFILKYMQTFLKQCVYLTEWHLFELYAQKEYRSIDRYKNAQILILDEIGKRELVEWQRVQLEELISYRYNEMLPTIFITNLKESEFKEFVGDRLADRLRDNNIKRIVFNEQSLRGVE